MELAEKFEQLQEYCYLLEKTLDKQRHYISELEELQNQFDDLGDRLDDLEKWQKDVGGRLDDVEYNVDSAQADVDGLTERVGKIEERMEDGD